MRLRRRLLLVITAAILLAVAIAGAGAWYVLGEARRSGRIVGEILSSRLGFPVIVERAAVTGGRLRLRGVRVPPRSGAPIDVKIGEVDVEGDVVSLVAPAGRRVSIVATSTTITVTDIAGSKSPTAAIGALRTALVSLLQWPGALSVRVQGGELTRRGHTFALELNAERTTTGLTLVLALVDADGPVLRVTTQSVAPADGLVTTHVELAGVPSRLGGLWPVSLPAPVAVAGRADVQLRGGGDMTANARLTVGDPGSPAMVDFASHWDPSKAEMVVSRYTIDVGRELHLEGAATLPADGRPLTGHAQGAIDGSAVRGRVAYEMSRAAFEGEVTVEPFSVQNVARRLGTVTPIEITARTLAARFSGAAGGERPTTSVSFTAGMVTTSTLPHGKFEATGSAAIALASSRAVVVALDSAQIALSHAGRRVGRLTASSRRDGVWPIEIQADVDDAAALVPVLPVPARVAGRASVSAQLLSANPPTLRATVQAHLTDIDVTGDGHVTLAGVRATIPVGIGVDASPPGRLTAERVSIYGFTALGVTASARLSDGWLRLPDIHFTHYDGEGGGWLDAALDGRAVTVQARVEGRRVDLAALVRDLGPSPAQISGRLHYILTAQYTADRGLAAAGQLASDEGGGEVNIEPIQRLLDSPAVQAETTGVLRQALQNLRVFRYESLEGMLRWNHGAGHVDLSLRGRKRLGIFPGPIEAINFRNVPLTVLARTLTGGTTR